MGRAFIHKHTQACKSMEWELATFQFFLLVLLVYKIKSELMGSSRRLESLYIHSFNLFFLLELCFFGGEIFLFTFIIVLKFF
jgi:hypothetical protein